jgi:hypothetical protein
MNGIYIESEKLLSRPDCVRWLDGCGAETGSGRKLSKMLNEMVDLDNYAVGFCSRYKEFTCSLTEYYNSDSYTHIPDPEQFCKEVAKRLGIEEPRFGVDDQIADEQDESFYLGSPDRLYPHKTYRVLDSLDGIPLDTRIPLSEWIPPFGKEVLWIFKDSRFFSELDRVGSQGITVSAMDIRLPLSGHWMRIV